MTLKEALKLNSEDIKKLKDDLTSKIKENKIGAYIEQLENKDINQRGSGIPIAIKNNINVKDWEITCSSNILKAYIAPFDASVITKLENAGFSPFGLTNMDEFAMGSSTESSIHGKTLNPHDNSRIAGGSSGGSAAAVASGLAIAALGTDTGGSIRQPASYCGVVGMKPSYGRVSRYGITAYSSSLDQCGVITKNVEDAAILYDAIAGYDEKDSTSANISYEKVSQNLNSDRKLKIVVIDNFIDKASSSVQDAYNKTIELLKEAGHEIINKKFMDADKIVSAYYIISSAEASTNLARFDGVRFGTRADSSNLNELYINTKSKGFGYQVQKRAMFGSFVLSSGYYDTYYSKAQKVRTLVKNEFDEIFKDADLILTPVTPTTAPKFDSYKTSLDMYLADSYTVGANLAGLPAISIPVGTDENNLPVGLQLIANSFEEQTLFDGALSMEKAVNYKK